MKKNSSENTEAWPDAATRNHAIEQAKQLRDTAKEGGLRFEAYLPPDLALWLLDQVEQERFLDPSEAAFVLLWQAQELAPHHDLQQELLNRKIQAAIDDPRPGIPAEQVFTKLKEKLKQPIPEPAVWKKKPQS